jgi:hypothetical protein
MIHVYAAALERLKAFAESGIAGKKRRFLSQNAVFEGWRRWFASFKSCPGQSDEGNSTGTGSQIADLQGFPRSFSSSRR